MLRETVVFSLFPSSQHPLHLHSEPWMSLFNLADPSPKFESSIRLNHLPPAFLLRRFCPCHKHIQGHEDTAQKLVPGLTLLLFCRFPLAVRFRFHPRTRELPRMDRRELPPFSLQSSFKLYSSATLSVLQWWHKAQLIHVGKACGNA